MKHEGDPIYRNRALRGIHNIGRKAYCAGVRRSACPYQDWRTADGKPMEWPCTPRPSFYQLPALGGTRLDEKLYKWEDLESELASDARAERALVFEPGPGAGLTVSAGGVHAGDDEARVLLDALRCL